MILEFQFEPAAFLQNFRNSLRLAPIRLDGPVLAIIPIPSCQAPFYLDNVRFEEEKIDACLCFDAIDMHTYERSGSVRSACG